MIPNVHIQELTGHGSMVYITHMGNSSVLSHTNKGVFTEVFLIYSNLYGTFRCYSQGYTLTGELCHSLAGLALET